jgi:hypothetical protein
VYAAVEKTRWSSGARCPLPRDSNFLDSRAYVYLRMGKYAEAIKESLQASIPSF